MHELVPPDTASFIKIHAFLVNIDRRLGRLLYLVSTRSGALGLIHRGTPLVALHIRSSAIYILCSIGLKCVLARIQRAIGGTPCSVRLPDQGDIAVFHFPAGVRVFDLQNRRISNLTLSPGSEAPQQREAVLNEQEMLGTVGLAPRVWRRDELDGGYIEEMCDGEPLKFQAWWEDGIFQEVTDTVRAIQNVRPAIRRQMEETSRALVDWLEVIGSRCAPFVDSEMQEWLQSEVRTVLNAVEMDAYAEGCLSHGDLARRNILLRANKGVMFIDWETVGYRVRDYDIYNYHFSIIQDGCSDVLPEAKVFEHLDKALSQSSPERAVKQLWCFRLDFLVTRMKYFLLPNIDDEAGSSRALTQLREFTECFARYEAHCVARSADGAARKLP